MYIIYLADIDASTGLVDALKTSLLIASELGHIDVVNVLVDNGADLFYCDTNGYCALQLAQMKEHQDVAELLMNSIGKIKQFYFLIFNFIL